MSLLFNTQSGFVIIFLPRGKCHLISWLQSLSTVISEPKKIKSITVSIVYPSVWHEAMGPDAMILGFQMLSFKPAFSLSSFTLIKRLFSSSLLSATRVVSSAYLRLLVFFLAILIPACNSSSLAFHMMYSAYTLNKQSNNYSLDVLLSQLKQVHCSMSGSNCCFLICIQISQEAGKVVWYSHLFKDLPQFFVIHTVKGFSIVNEAEADVFMEFSCFFYDPVDVFDL